MKVQKYSFINDAYRTERGGKAVFYNIYCENCGEYVLLYQKDGPGPLKRMYYDRIIAPQNLTGLGEISKVADLSCHSCKRLLAIPSIYDRENRKAYALLAYMVIKKRTSGVYPPKTKKIPVED